MIPTKVKEKDLSDLIYSWIPHNYNLPVLFEGRVNTTTFQNDTERALSILRDHAPLKEHNHVPKFFCNAEEQYNIFGFEVKSSSWDWIVTPVTAQNKHLIPPELLLGVLILLDNNVKIQGLALAKPIPNKSVSAVAKQKLYHTLRIYTSVFLFFLFGIAKVISGALTSAANAVDTLIEPRDPVLLVKVQDKWIEIGRWE